MRERRVQATKELEVRRAASNVHSCSLLASAQSVAQQPAGRLKSHPLQRHLMSFWRRMSPFTMTTGSPSKASLIQTKLALFALLPPPDLQMCLFLLQAKCETLEAEKALHRRQVGNAFTLTA